MARALADWELCSEVAWMYISGIRSKHRDFITWLNKFTEEDVDKICLLLEDLEMEKDNPHLKEDTMLKKKYDFGEDFTFFIEELPNGDYKLTENIRNDVYEHTFKSLDKAYEEIMSYLNDFKVINP